MHGVGLTDVGQHVVGSSVVWLQVSSLLAAAHRDMVLDIRILTVETRGDRQRDVPLLRDLGPVRAWGPGSGSRWGVCDPGRGGRWMRCVQHPGLVAAHG